MTKIDGKLKYIYILIIDDSRFHRLHTTAIKNGDRIWHVVYCSSATQLQKNFNLQFAKVADTNVMMRYILYCTALNDAVCEPLQHTYCTAIVNAPFF